MNQESLDALFQTTRQQLGNDRLFEQLLHAELFPPQRYLPASSSEWRQMVDLIHEAYKHELSLRGGSKDP